MTAEDAPEPPSPVDAAYAERARTGLGLAVFALVALRVALSGHAPSAADAFLTAGFALVVIAAFVIDRELVARCPVGAVALSCLALLASVPTSWHPFFSLLALPAALAAFACFLAVAGVGARGYALLGVLAGAAASSSTALWQRYFSWPSALAERDRLALTPSQVERLESGRALGLSLSPDLMGALALAGVVAAAALFSSSKLPLARALALALGALSLAGMVVSRSAGVALAAGVVVAVLVLLAVVRGLRGPLAVAVVVVATLAPAALMATFGRGLAHLSSSASERLWNWQVGLDVWREHRLLGVGFGRFSAAYAAARPPEANVTRYAHSFVVDVLAEAGLIGGGVLLLVVACAVISLGRARARSRRSFTGDVVLAGVVGLLARSTFDYDLDIGANAGCLAALAGVAWLDARADGRGVIMSAGALPTTMRRRALLAVPLLASLLMAGIVAGMVTSWRESVLERFAGAAPSADDVRALYAYTELFGGDPHAVAIEARLISRQLETCSSQCDALVARARVLVADASSHPPSDVPLLAARLARREGDRGEALRQIERALALDPGDREAHVLRVVWARDDGDERVEDYERAAHRYRVVTPTSAR